MSLAAVSSSTASACGTILLHPDREVFSCFDHGKVVFLAKLLIQLLRHFLRLHQRFVLALEDL